MRSGPKSESDLLLLTLLVVITKFSIAERRVRDQGITEAARNRGERGADVCELAQWIV